jgi:hypothetical protein
MVVGEPQAQAAPQPEQVQRIVIREQREPREPREKPFTLDLQPLVFPALAIGTLFFIVEYKDQIANTITRLFNVLPHAGDIAGSIDVPDVIPPIGAGGGGGGGGGGTATGKQWYKANGSTTNLSTGRQDGSSNRWNKNVIGWQNGFEVMGYLTVTGMSGGSHIGLKMGGPNHSGGRECCWWDGGLRRNGTSYLEIEYPHPTNKNTKHLKSIGRNIDAGVLGIRWLNMKEGNARRVMLWVDKSKKVNAYKWELVYDIKDTGQFMPTSYYDEVPNNQELEIRISDVSASKIKWHTGPVARKINSGSNLATLDYSSFDRITVPY